MREKGGVLRAVLCDPFVAMLTLSVLIHGVLLLWFGHASEAGPALIAPQRGRFSIRMQASVAALPDRPEPRPEPPTPPPPPPPAPEPPPPRPNLPRLSEVRETIAPLKEWLVAAVAPARRLVTAMVEAPAVEEFDDQDPPPPSPPRRPPPPPDPDQEPPVPREETPPQPPAEMPRPVSSRPSPSSAASEGADVDEMPRIVTNPAPRYPAEALTAGSQGVVVLRVAIGADGKVTRAGVHRSSGVAALDEAALAAVRRWQFVPARRRGFAVAKEVAVPVRFSIRGR